MKEVTYLDILLPWRRKTETKTVCDRACNFLKEFMENTAALQVVLLSVETKKLELRWKVAKFYEQLQQLLQDIYILQGPTANLITYENFPKSYYREKERITHTNTYRAAFAVFGLIVNRMSELENLKKAYFKSRQALRWEFPCDEVEIKLFEQDLEHNLKQLAKRILSGYEFGEFPLEYEVPKNDKETRPRVMDSLSDSIVGAAFLDVVGRGIDKNFYKGSYGNRINGKIDSEYMYKHFWHSYRNFIYKSKSWFTKNNFNFFVKMDIKSFYPSVKQGKLIEKLVRLLPAKEPRVLKLLNSMIKRPIFGSPEGCGIPQGPICSGFLANCYLDDFDREMEAKWGQGAYRRYVDDMIIYTYDEVSHKAAIKYVSEKIGWLGLKIHTDSGKLKKGTIEDYISLIERDQELDDFQKDLSRILRGLYSLDWNNYCEFIRDPDGFVRLYSECLRTIGVIISPEWLRRKLFLGKGLSAALSFVSRYFSSQMYRVKFPNPAKLLSASEWAEDFESKNVKLAKNLKRLKEELENRLVKLYDCYGDLSRVELNPDIRKKITAKYRFYTYRASILYSPGVIPVIKEILPFPWLYNITVLRSYPELIPDLVRLLENSSSDYLKYVAIWALGEMKCSNAVSALAKVLFSDEDLGIKLMASQSLLKIDCWDGFDWERLEQEILRTQKMPRLLKNLILIWGRSGSDELRFELDECVREDENVANALRWINKRADNVMSLPDKLPEYIRGKEYPLMEPGLDITTSSYY
jgi:hypothetical protein